MGKRIKVHVGTLDEMGARFVNAWHRLERGEKVRERLGAIEDPGENHVPFASLSLAIGELADHVSVGRQV